MSFTFNIGQSLSIKNIPQSKIIGIDHYTFNSFQGKKLTWKSYTLVSEDQGLFSRWWLVDHPDMGLVCALPYEEEFPQDIQYEDSISGICYMDSEGDADLSTPYSALLGYWSEMNKTYYYYETFEGDAEAIKGQSIPLGPKDIIAVNE